MTTRSIVAVAALFAASVAGAATSLQVVLPASSRTGVSFSFSVTARNGAALDAAYTGTVHFTSSDSAATLPPDYTFTPADAGAHTFSATMATSGNGGQMNQTINQTITATDTSNASIAGTGSTAVKWGSDVVRQFSMAAPGTVQRNAAFQVVVSALNVDSEVVPSYRGTVHFHGSSGMIVPADYTFIAADNGVHSFTFTSTQGADNAIDVEDVSYYLIRGSTRFYVACPELTATAGNSGPVCAESTVVLYGSSNQADVTYSWYRDLPGPNSWSDPAQNPTAPGPGTYELTVTAPNRCEARAMTTVEPVPVHPIALTASPTEVCDSGMVNVSVVNPSAFTTFSWSTFPGNTPVPGSASSVNLTIEERDTTVTVRGKNADSGCNSTNSLTVLVNPILNIAVTAPPTACPGVETGAAASSSVYQAHSWHWSVTNATITQESGDIVKFIPNGSGDVSVTGTVYTRWGACNASVTKVIRLDGPSATLDTNLAVCRSEAVDIPVALTGTPPFELTWSDGYVQPNIMTTTARRSVVVHDSSDFAITSVRDANCVGRASGSAHIVVDSSVPEIVSAPRSVTVKPGERTTLSVEANGTNLRFDWYRGASGDRTNLLATGPAHTFTTPSADKTTSYWVEVVGGCGTVASSTAVVSLAGGGKHRSVGH